MKLFLIAEVAEQLRCSPSLVYEHIAQGRMRAFRVGGKKGYRVSEEQLAEFLRNSETDVANPEESFQHVR